MLPNSLIILTILGLLTLTACVFVMRSRRLAITLSKAEKRADTDRLTGLLNRGAFNLALTDAFHQAEQLNLVYIDLANFKEVNDVCGHDAGDVVLRRVSEILLDAVPGNAAVARMGGDEFCILLPEHSLEESMQLCSAVYRACRCAADLPVGISTIDVSIGLAASDESCSTSEELLRRSDRAMYHAKSEKQGPELYTPQLDEEFRVRREIRTQLGAAFLSDKLKLAYQPMINARTGELAGAEALLRWPEKIGRAGSPAEFIPIAEETGLIIDIGAWVIEKALAEVTDLGVPIAVNVSPRQFLDADFSVRVADAIITAGVPPEMLKIEITESVLITHTETASRILRELHDIGVRILLDDFGTGYSSLSYIQKFNFDMLKIDRAFVRAMDGSNAGADLMSAIINLGHSLDMKVVAEGVETRRQCAALQLLGVDYMQGYALGAPGPIERLRDFKPLLASPEDVSTATDASLKEVS